MVRSVRLEVERGQESRACQALRETRSTGRFEAEERCVSGKG